MIQVDGPKRRVFIKFINGVRMYRLLRDTAGTLEFKYDTGELSNVHIAKAGMEMWKVGIANLPSEVPDRKIRGSEGHKRSIMGKGIPLQSI